MAKKSKVSSGLKKLGCLAILLLIVFLFFYLRSQRYHRYWHVEQSMINGDTIRLKFDYNTRKIFFSFPGRHPSVIIGGGDLRYDLYYNYAGKDYHIRTYSLPVLINFWEGRFYFVTLGSEGKVGRERKFRFYSFDKEWVEIKAEAFPKQLAIPNIYFVRNYPEICDPVEIEPKSKEFRYSLTARLWLRLEKGKTYHETRRRSFKPYEVDKSFLDRYMKIYISPYWDLDKINMSKSIVVSGHKSID